jgi:hypothetical protein
VNAILPGPMLAPEAAGAESLAEATERTLLRRPGSPEDIASAVRYLLVEGTYLTGAVSWTGALIGRWGARAETTGKGGSGAPLIVGARFSRGYPFDHPAWPPEKTEGNLAGNTLPCK